MDSSRPSQRWTCRLYRAAFITWLTVLVMSLPGRILADPPRDAGITIEELIQGVRANEGLYRDIEFRMHSTYKRGPDVIRDARSLVDCDRDTWVVYQPNRMFLKEAVRQRRADGPSMLFDTIQGYDGKVTRQVDQQETASIHDGLHEDPRLIRPHTLLQGIDRQVTIPLSTYLGGSEAINTLPGDSYLKQIKIRSRVLGREVVNGLICYKVSVDKSFPGKPQFNGAQLLWLARDRNLLPVKMESLPSLAGEVREFREVVPGVWLPARASITTFNPRRPKQDGQPSVENETLYELGEARLHPNYPDSFFRDIAIPNGMTVNELRGGKIVRSYIQGGSADERERSEAARKTERKE